MVTELHSHSAGVVRPATSQSSTRPWTDWLSARTDSTDKDTAENTDI